MGYDVYYNGEVDVTPPLTENDAAILRAVVNREQTDETRTIFAAIAASAEPDLPGHAGLLEVSEDRSCILPEEGESRHGLRMWLRLLLEHFLVPRGYVLNGEIWWEGQDPDDRGGIFIKDNQLEAIDDLIFNAGPSRVETSALERWLQHARINEDHVGHVPPNLGPGMMVTLPSGCGMPLIDGNHRAARALRDGREFLVFVLSEPETLDLLRRSMGNAIAEDYWKRMLHSKPHSDDDPEGEQQ